MERSGDWDRMAAPPGVEPVLSTRDAAALTLRGLADRLPRYTD
jgi:hypothetical protein